MTGEAEGAKAEDIRLKSDNSSKTVGRERNAQQQRKQAKTTAKTAVPGCHKCEKTRKTKGKNKNNSAFLHAKKPSEEKNGEREKYKHKDVLHVRLTKIHSGGGGGVGGDSGPLVDACCRA